MDSSDYAEGRSGWGLGWYWVRETLLGGAAGGVVAIIWVFLAAYVKVKFDRILSTFNPPQVSFENLRSTATPGDILAGIERSEPAYTPIFILITFIVAGYLFNYFLAFYQVPVFKRVLGDAPGIERWTSHSARAAALAALVIFGDVAVPNIEYHLWMDHLLFYAALVIFGFFQWRLLRHYFGSAYIWVVLFVIIVLVQRGFFILAENSDSTFWVFVYPTVFYILLPVFARAAAVVRMARDPIPLTAEA